MRSKKIRKNKYTIRRTKSTTRRTKSTPGRTKSTPGRTKSTTRTKYTTGRNKKTRTKLLRIKRVGGGSELGDSDDKPTLPNEIITHITKFLPSKDIASLSQTHKAAADPSGAIQEVLSKRKTERENEIKTRPVPDDVKYATGVSIIPDLTQSIPDDTISIIWSIADNAEDYGTTANISKWSEEKQEDFEIALIRAINTATNSLQPIITSDNIAFTHYGSTTTCLFLSGGNYDVDALVVRDVLHGLGVIEVKLEQDDPRVEEPVKVNITYTGRLLVSEPLHVECMRDGLSTRPGWSGFNRSQIPRIIEALRNTIGDIGIDLTNDNTLVSFHRGVCLFCFPVGAGITPQTILQITGALVEKPIQFSKKRKWTGYLRMRIWIELTGHGTQKSTEFLLGLQTQLNTTLLNGTSIYDAVVNGDERRIGMGRGIWNYADTNTHTVGVIRGRLLPLKSANLEKIYRWARHGLMMGVFSSENAINELNNKFYIGNPCICNPEDRNNDYSECLDTYGGALHVCGYTRGLYQDGTPVDPVPGAQTWMGVELWAIYRTIQAYGLSGDAKDTFLNSFILKDDSGRILNSFNDFDVLYNAIRHPEVPRRLWSDWIAEDRMTPKMALSVFWPDIQRDGQYDITGGLGDFSLFAGGGGGNPGHWRRLTATVPPRRPRS